MIIHTISMAAFLLDTVQLAHCTVPCVPTAPDPSWKWFVQSVIPVAGGVAIAVWSFHANSGKEHRQRMLDKRAGEWRAVLDALLSVYKGLPAAFSVSFQKTLSNNSSATDADLLNAWQVKSRIDTLLYIRESAKGISLTKEFDNLIETAKNMKIKSDSEGKFDGFVQADQESYKKQFESLLAMVYKQAIEDAANQENARTSFWNPYSSI